MSRFSGKYAKKAMREVKERKQLEARVRQAEFDEDFNINADGADRKTYGKIRYVRRITSASSSS